MTYKSNDLPPTKYTTRQMCPCGEETKSPPVMAGFVDLVGSLFSWSPTLAPVCGAGGGFAFAGAAAQDGGGGRNFIDVLVVDHNVWVLVPQLLLNIYNFYC